MPSLRHSANDREPVPWGASAPFGDRGRGYSSNYCVCFQPETSPADNCAWAEAALLASQLPHMFTIYFWRNYDEALLPLTDSEMQLGSVCLCVCACVSLCMWVWQECVAMVVYNFQKNFPNCLATADRSERLLNPFFNKVSSVYTQFFRRIGGVLFAPIRQWHCSESVHGLSVSVSLVGIASLPSTVRFRTFKWAITSQHQHKSRIQFGRLKITRRKDLKFLAKQIQEREHCWVKASESHLFTVFRKKKKA